MNETVKKALLAERRDVQRIIQDHERSVADANARAAAHEAALAPFRQQLADFEAHLTEAGVDLATEDATVAERTPTFVGGHTMLGQQLGQAQSAIGNDLGQMYGQNATNARQRCAL